jgi:hypothetical protein
MMDPYFYRNHLARRYYLDHVNLKHKDFAAWDHKIQLIYGLVALATAVSALLFFGALGGRFPSVHTPIFETLFLSSLVAIAVFVFVVARGRRRFRELWDQQNGFSANKQPDA